jgi:AcrR family transcriptional regulator
MKWLIDSKKQDTKLPQLIRAAVKLFVEHGIEATTTKQIAELAEVAEGTLYRHFKGKEDLAFKVFITHMEAFTAELEKAAAPMTGTKDKLRAIILCYFTFFETERTLFEYLLHSEHRELRNYPVIMKQPLTVLLGILEDGAKSGDIPQQDLTFAAAFVIGMVHRVSIFRMYGRIEESLVHHVDRVADACWRVLK